MIIICKLLMRLWLCHPLPLLHHFLSCGLPLLNLLSSLIVAVWPPMEWRYVSLPPLQLYEDWRRLYTYREFRNQPKFQHQNSNLKVARYCNFTLKNWVDTSSSAAGCRPQWWIVSSFCNRFIERNRTKHFQHGFPLSSSLDCTMWVGRGKRFGSTSMRRKCDLLLACSMCSNPFEWLNLCELLIAYIPHKTITFD